MPVLGLSLLPEALYYIGAGSTVMLNGFEFRLEVVEHSRIEEVFLTATDPALKATVDYEYTTVHVRQSDNKAVFTREQLVELIKSGDYHIG